MVQSFSCVRLFVTTWTIASQVSLFFTISRSLLKLLSLELVMLSNHFILCHPFLLLPSVLPSIRIFSNESTLHVWWPNYWGFSFSISPSKEYSGLISFRIFTFIQMEGQPSLPMVWTEGVSVSRTRTLSRKRTSNLPQPLDRQRVKHSKTQTRMPARQVAKPKGDMNTTKSEVGSNTKIQKRIIA